MTTEHDRERIIGQILEYSKALNWPEPEPKPDPYGFTPEERGAFEQWAHDDGATYLMLTCENGTGVYNNSRSHFNAEGWAACAKRNREKLAGLEKEVNDLKDVAVYAYRATDASWSATRIKELEAENARLAQKLETADRALSNLSAHFARGGK